jgi:hypothetical protein
VLHQFNKGSHASHSHIIIDIAELFFDCGNQFPTCAIIALWEIHYGAMSFRRLLLNEVGFLTVLRQLAQSIYTTVSHAPGFIGGFVCELIDNIRFGHAARNVS